jgi:hypothetical protein
MSHTYIGWPFLSRFSIEIFADMNHRIIRSNSSADVADRIGIPISFIENNLGLKPVHRWMVLSFCCLLILLKGYHLYFKSLPRSSYREFDSIVDAGNNNSSSSTHSEGDESDKDRFSDLSS